MFLRLNSGDTLSAVMSGAASTTNPTYSVVAASESYTGSLSGTTSVNMLAPVGPTPVESLWLHNADTAAATITVSVSKNGTTTEYASMTIQPDNVLVIDKTGARMLDDAASQVSGVTAGTVSASKALVVDANKDLATIRYLTVEGLESNAQSVTPNNDSGSASSITAGVTAVDVGAVTNDANDWIVLPSLADVPIGHTIKIACNAGGNFELRTPASSGEKVNNVDSDGTQEYLCTDTDTVIIWKQSATDGWIAQSITALGAVRTAVVPD